MMPRCGFVWMLCCSLFSNAHAQSFFENNSIAARGFCGTFLTSQPKAQYLRDGYSYFGEVALLHQTNGSQQWHWANRLPQTGVALFYGYTGSRSMGTMAGLFPFINWRLYRTPKFNSSLRGGVGLGWVQKPYDKISNHKNVLIGTHLNAYINFLWQAELTLFSNLHAGAGLGFSHFSNGSSTLPNLGLNIPSLTVGLRYDLKHTPIVPRKPARPLSKKTAVTMLTSLGIKQAPWIEGKRFLVNTAQVEWSRALYASGRYSGGAALFYNRALSVSTTGVLDQKAVGSNIQAGLFAGYEHLLGRLSVPVQLGVYVYNSNIYPLLFQQLGLRYRIGTNWSAQLAMKTHSGKADFIHVGVGYRLK